MSRDYNTQVTIYSQTMSSYVMHFHSSNLFYVVPVQGTATMNGVRTLYDAMKLQKRFDSDAAAINEQGDINTLVHKYSDRITPGQ